MFSDFWTSSKIFRHLLNLIPELFLIFSDVSRSFRIFVDFPRFFPDVSRFCQDLSRFVRCFPDFSGLFPDCSGLFLDFSRIFQNILDLFMFFKFSRFAFWFLKIIRKFHQIGFWIFDGFNLLILVVSLFRDLCFFWFRSCSITTHLPIPSDPKKQRSEHPQNPQNQQTTNDKKKVFQGS